VLLRLHRYNNNHNNNNKNNNNNHHNINNQLTSNVNYAKKKQTVLNTQSVIKIYANYAIMRNTKPVVLVRRYL